MWRQSCETFMIQYTKFKGQENSGTALKLFKTTARIVNSTFVSNRRGYRHVIFLLYYYEAFIGGAIFATIHVSS